jgi:vacuolar protein sorting-associated protein 41
MKQHALSLPSLQPLRVYHAHAANVSAVSMSPYPPPLPLSRGESINRLVPTAQSFNPTRNLSGSSSQKQSPKPAAVPATPSNSIYIATAAIDGNVCISSLIDPKDVQLRNFGRPVHAVALSPNYKQDHNYLSGGQAGSLVLTSGGQAGRSSNANLGGAAAAAQGWLGAVGLGSNTGSDKILHGGEGIISTISWSLSGKYVLWVNEHGIKIMRSNLHLDSADSALEWKRLSHIDRPSRENWDDMAGLWKASVEWIDRSNLETEGGHKDHVPESNGRSILSTKSRSEEIVVGWGDTVWLIRIQDGTSGASKVGEERKIGRAEVTNM